MKPPPPWRWPLGGPWPPADDQNQKEQPSPEEQIRPLAERLSKQRPWLSEEENWFAAERALKQRPWRPWLIRFSGQQERSGWDWSELVIKVSVPVLIVALGAGLSRCASVRDERAARKQRESAVVTSFIGEMQKLVLADRLIPGKKGRSEFLVIPRELTVAALAQLNSDEAMQERNQILRFVRGLGLMESGKGELFFQADLNSLNLSRANLAKTDLRGADLSEAALTGANLSGAFLRGAHLNGANLTGASLDGADLSGAFFSGADLSGIQWDDKTQWPETTRLRDARNIPPKLRKQLRLP